MKKIDRTSPVLIGGLVGGVLAGIPLLNCLNCFCCSLYILAGGIAGMLYARGAGAVNLFPSTGQGALTGGLAGGLAGIIGSLIGGVLTFALSAAGMGGQDPAEIMENLPPDLDPEAVEAIGQLLELFGGPPTVGKVLIGAVIGIVLGFLFGLLGGAVGCAMSRKPPVPQPAAPAAPPYQAPPPPDPLG
jgi:hypothetical protein